MTQDSLHLLVGTRRGLFRYVREGSETWRRDGFAIEGHEIYHAVLEPGTGAGFAAAVHPVWGAHVYRTRDGGATWQTCGARPAFPAESGRGVAALWHVAIGRAPNGARRVYAGAEPAALFVSDDDGDSWAWNEALDEHPTRETWQPAKGGLALHSIQPDPASPARVYVALSAGGCYRTEDAGRTWTAINRGVRADFLPEADPVAGHCVHALRLHPTLTTRLYQQNHCGTYRSDDRGETWREITDGLPSDFGYVLGLDPADPDRCWVIPEESSHLRSVCDRRLRVFESADGGDSWVPRCDGLPQEDAWVTVLREGLGTARPAASAGSCGVYFGTATGHLYASPDGHRWREIASHLPKVLSVEACYVG